MRAAPPLGVTRVDQRRFRGLVRLLEAYAEGRELDVPEWNKDVPLPQFVRWAADDLKAFYLEARMQQSPDCFIPGAERLVVDRDRAVQPAPRRARPHARAG